MDPQAPIRVLVADDHGVVRAGICHWLDQEPDLIVVGQATSGEEVLRLVSRLTPDVVLADIRMPGTSGLELAHLLRARHPGIHVVLMTSHKGWHTHEILALDGVGYLTKEAERELFVLAVRWAAAGRRWLDPTELQEEMARTRELDALELTPTERLILQRINRSNAEICVELGMKESTLRKTHLSNLFFKIMVSKRQEAIAWARARKLLLHPD